jgi:hypothetical protein
MRVYHQGSSLLYAFFICSVLLNTSTPFAFASFDFKKERRLRRRRRLL